MQKAGRASLADMVQLRSHDAMRASDAITRYNMHVKRTFYKINTVIQINANKRAAKQCVTRDALTWLGQPSHAAAFPA